MNEPTLPLPEQAKQQEALGIPVLVVNVRIALMRA